MRDDLNVEFVVFRSIGARITGSGLPSKGLTVYPSRLVGFPRDVDSENRDETLGLRTVLENGVSFSKTILQYIRRPLEVIMNRRD